MIALPDQLTPPGGRRPGHGLPTRLSPVSVLIPVLDYLTITSTSQLEVIPPLRLFTVIRIGREQGPHHHDMLAKTSTIAGPWLNRSCGATKSVSRSETHTRCCKLGRRRHDTDIAVAGRGSGRRIFSAAGLSERGAALGERCEKAGPANSPARRYSSAAGAARWVH